MYAPDAEAYTLFAPLFNPVIQVFHSDLQILSSSSLILVFKVITHAFKEYHNGFAPDAKQPPKDLGEDKLDQLGDLDPEGKFINR